MTGTASAMPTKLEGSASSEPIDETTMPGWVLRKKLSGRVMMWANRPSRMRARVRWLMTTWIELMMYLSRLAETTDTR